MADGVRSVVLVEGDSDRVALETLAARRGIDLGAAGVQVVAVGGVTNVRRALVELAPRGLRLTVLCDRAEEAVVRRATEVVGPAVGVHVCTADLEDELIRAAGSPAVLAVIAAQGEDRSFWALRQQPAHRGRPVEHVLRRFMGSRSGRKAAYARLLVEALPLDGVPAVLDATLAAALPLGDLPFRDLPDGDLPGPRSRAGTLPGVGPRGPGEGGTAA